MRHFRLGLLGEFRVLAAIGQAARGRLLDGDEDTELL